MMAEIRGYVSSALMSDGHIEKLAKILKKGSSRSHNKIVMELKEKREKAKANLPPNVRNVIDRSMAINRNPAMYRNMVRNRNMVNPHLPKVKRVEALRKSEPKNVNVRDLLPVQVERLADIFSKNTDYADKD